MSVKVIQLFETYGDLYQPYIPPVMEALKEIKDLHIQVDAFVGNSENNDVNIIPSYYKRKIKERVSSIKNKSSFKKLNYTENKYLKSNSDVIHLQHSYLHSKFKRLLAIPKNERPKVVITLRGGDTYLKPWLDKNWLEFYKGYGQLVDAYIVMTNHQKMYMQKWGIALEKIHVIPISYGNPFDVEAKIANRKTIRLISAFRMCWEKNIEGNLRVVKNLIERGFDVNYSIYGSGQDAHQVPYLIDKYQLSNFVSYQGSISHKELKKNIKDADFYLQLSHSESLGMSIIESQTFGLPAVVSDSDGIPEVVLHNKTGFCVKSYDTETAANYIELLWKNSKLYTEFSKAAIAHSQSSFSLQIEVERLLKLYKSINL